MGYLLQQIFWYCLLSFLLGFVVAWWLVRAGARRTREELEARITGLRTRVSDLEEEIGGLRVRLSECEGELATAAEAAAHRHHGTDVEAIEGIGPGYGRRLKEAGIRTVEALLEACATDEGVERVRSATDQEEHVVHTWAIAADLMRIRGLGGQWAELLWRTGVTSVQDLASRDPAALVERMEEVNQTEHRVHELPGLKRVQGFIDAAGELPRAIPDRAGLE